MARADERLTKRETLPVVDSDGRVRGSCTIRKFLRKAGECYNEITVYDTEARAVAHIAGYRLHSRISCGDAAGNSKRIDSKDAVIVARAALECGRDQEAMLGAIQELAETLAEQRSLKRRRRRG